MVFSGLFYNDDEGRHGGLPHQIFFRVGMTTSFKDIGLRELARRKLHHGSDCYLNPFNPDERRGLIRLLRWKLASGNRFKPFYSEERVTPVSIDWIPVRETRGLSVTFLRHASVLIRDRECSILVDPVLFGLSPAIKDFTPIAFDIAEIPRPDHLLITHGHYDHLDARSLKAVGREANILTPLGYGDVLAGLRGTRHRQLDWFEPVGDGEREITLLPCNHWTMRNPLKGPDRALWGSWLIRSASGPTIYVSGDTAYFDRFAEIGRVCDIDLAIFNLGDDPVHFPPLDIRREMEREGLGDRLVDVRHGETLFLS